MSDSDAHEAARAAARDAGLSLEEWIEDIIADHAEKKGFDDEDLDEDERVEAVSAALSRLMNKRSRKSLDNTEEDDLYPKRRGQLDHEIDDDSYGDNARRDVRGSRSARRRDILSRDFGRNDSGRTGNSRDAEGLLEAAIDAIDTVETRTRDNEAKTARSLSRLARWMEESEERREKEQKTLKQVARRLAAIEDEVAVAVRTLPSRAGVAGQAFSGFQNADTALAQISARQRELEAGAAGPSMRPAQPSFGQRSGPVPQGGIKSQIEALSQQVAAMRGPRQSNAQFGQAQASLSSRRDIEHLRNEVASLSQSLNHLASRSSVASLEEAIRDLGDRIEHSREGGVREGHLAPIERLARDIRGSLGEIDSVPAIQMIQDAIKGIGQKVENLGERGVDQDNFQRIDSQIREIRDLLSVAAAQPMPAERIEHQIAELAARVDQLSNQRPSSLDISAVIDEIRTLLDRSHPTAGLETLERRIEALSEKIDSALTSQPQQQTQNPTIDSSELMQLLQALEQQVLQSRRTQVNPEMMASLEQQVSMIAHRLEQPEQRPSAEHGHLGQLLHTLEAQIAQARLSQIDPNVIASLEQQVGMIAQKLDHSDQGFSALSSIERAINDIFIQMEETRRVANEAATAAGRTAAREAVREMMERMPAAAAPQYAPPPIEELRGMERPGNSVEETNPFLRGREAAPEPFMPNATAHRPAAQLSAEQPAPPATARRPSLHASRDEGIAGIDDPDFLIEPGKPYTPNRKSETQTPGTAPDISKAAVEGKQAVPEAGPVTATNSFVLAAQRAAAAQSVGGAEKSEAKKAPNTLGGTRRATGFNGTWFKKLLLGLAALVLVIGCIGIARIAFSAKQPDGVKNSSSVPVKPKPDGTSVDGKNGAASTTSPGPTSSPTSSQRNNLLPVSPATQPLNEPSSNNGAEGTMPDQGPAVPRSSSQLSQPGQKTGMNGSNQFGTMGSADTKVTGIGGAAAQSPFANIDPTNVASIASKPSAPPQGYGITPALRAKAASGNSAAQYEMGARLAEGRGVARDYKSAAQWFEKAAAQGLVPAQYRLGALYEKGLGVPRDLAQARTLYQKAAEKGNARAMHNLAVLTAEGPDGKPDYNGAANWFRKASEMGIRDSQYNLAILYARGLGVAQNMQQSWLWFALAAAQGDEDAARKRDEVEARLSPKDIAGAKALLDGFKPNQAEKAANEVVPPPETGEADNVPPPAKSGAKPTQRPKT